MRILPIFVLLVKISSVQTWLFSSQVCYGDLGCFSGGPPFDNTLGELPDSPEEVQVRTLLWTKQNPTDAQELNYHNISSIKESNFDASRPTKVLIHGYMNNKDRSAIIANLSIAFLERNDFNVIGVDWSKGASKFYPKAVANTRLVGAVLSKLLRTLIDNFELKVDNLHVLGHSLGAHIAGYVGTSIPRIARITDAFINLSCAHGRAIWYFIESVINMNCSFISYPCSSWSRFQNGTCNSCEGNVCPVMGINADQFQMDARGSFYLQTGSRSPFCSKTIILMTFNVKEGLVKRRLTCFGVNSVVEVC